jgi:exopolyphosphatase/guanosine-5'-triphosphate,3'-diphosphate pyrophosphatase
MSSKKRSEAPRFAVLDLGSNSLKCLVASRSGKTLQPHFEETKEVRLSNGITGSPPRLSEAAFQRGLEAVVELWQACQLQGPLAGACIVATSAIRTASNGSEFCQAVEMAVGCPVEVISGKVEAAAVARGVLADPSLQSHPDSFTLFDLGGGSLELIEVVGGRSRQCTSLPLGGVRLTEQFISSPQRPIPQTEREALSQYLKTALTESTVPLRAPLVGCSGGLATLRGLPAHLRPDPGPAFSREWLAAFSARVLGQTFAERVSASHLPESRADIFPAALILFQTLLDVSGAPSLTHSFYNLRFGIAAQLISAHENE